MAANHGLLEEDGVFQFTLILARWTRLTIKGIIALHNIVAKLPIGHGFHCIPYLALILY